MDKQTAAETIVTAETEATEQTEVTAEPTEQAATEQDETVVMIGEEELPEDESKAAPEWIRDLRKKNREDQRRIRELEEKLSATQETKQSSALGKKPTLEDHDYDTDKFEQALTVWHERKREIDKAEAEKKTEEAKQQEAWQAKLNAYGEAKSELKFNDYDDAEQTVQESFSVIQQGIIIQGAEKPALVIYALGRNPKKAAELKAITDPVKFAFAIAKLETQLKITTRKAETEPEKIIKGTAPVSGAIDSALERLREEAARTGDMTKVVAYKRNKRQN